MLNSRSGAPSARYLFPDALLAMLFLRPPRPGPPRRPACAWTTTRSTRLSNHTFTRSPSAPRSSSPLCRTERRRLRTATTVFASPRSLTKTTSRSPPSASRQDSLSVSRSPQGLAKDASTTLTFEYEGAIENADDSPVPGLSLAYIGDDTSYLLYCRTLVPGQRLRHQPLYLDHQHHGPRAHDRRSAAASPRSDNAPSDKPERQRPAHQDFYFRLRQAQFPRHHRRRRFPGV